MKPTGWSVLAAVLFLLLPWSARAHFGMLIPSDSMIMQGEGRTVHLTVSFSHPFEGVGMPMERPRAFGVQAGGKRTDLAAALKEAQVMGHRAWEADVPVKRPGVYTFFLEPSPYWEPAEDCFIVHYTKTAVAAFGDEEGWDEELGLKTEIVPLTRPFGLYAGNVFQGIVKKDGKPVPFAEVEVEYYNEGGKARAATDYLVTQVLKADPNGVFTYAAPVPGWWGFAALSTAEEKMKHQGEDKDVELGAVIWVRFEPWPGPGSEGEKRK